MLQWPWMKRTKKDLSKIGEKQREKRRLFSSNTLPRILQHTNIQKITHPGHAYENEGKAQFTTLEFEPIQPDSETIGDVDRWEDDDNFEGNHDEGDEEPIVRRRLRRRYHWDKPEGSTSQFREHSQSQSDTEEDPSIDQEIYLGSRERSVTLGRDTPPPHPPEHGQSQSDARGDQLIDQEGIWLRARQRSTSLRSRSLSPPTIIVGELASAIHQQSPDRVPHPRRKKVTVPRSYNTIDAFKRMVGSLDGPEYWLT
ncbi:hypothetical protein NPX13_g7692 [Xylaria arbuscula]|uniref:Uncharacterized protein n=1 Tax=Xylaria arbuscula TaxID=114810 RepID=A0A9W8N9U7_9PEZI|nr:hypothetical protein NPX13_g7692 [Xylaria arbuscula]